MRLAYLAIAAAVFTVAPPRDAAANGRFPASNEIFFSPADATFVGTRATFGILLSGDDGGSWAWLCEDTIGLGPKTMEDPPLAMTGGGSLVAALSFGLDVSTDRGCDWSFAGGPLAGQVVKDLALRPDSPRAVVAVTGTYGATAGEGGAPGYLQQVYETVDDGAHWSPLGDPIDPSALVTTVDVAPSDPDRLYASAVRHATSLLSASLFVSTNAGTSWTERPVPFDPTRSTAIFVAAVDPTKADVVYVRSDGQSQLFVTADAGETWETPLSIGDPMLGFALSSDGSQVYAGSVAAGLLAASAGALSFAQVSSIHVQCLATRGPELWACSDEPSGFIVGRSTTGGSSFASVLPNLLGIQGPIACPPGSGAGICASFDFDASPPYDPLAALCTNLGACAASPPAAFTEACTRAGECGDAGADAPTSAATRSRSSCGCAAAGVPGASGAAIAGALLLVVGGRRALRRGQS